MNNYASVPSPAPPVLFEVSGFELDMIAEADYFVFCL